MRLGLGLVAVVCGVSVVSIMGAVACKSESDPPVYLDADYQVRCLDCSEHAGDAPEREIAYLDGEFDWKIECSVRRVGGEPVITLNASYQADRESDEYGFRLRGVTIGDGDQNDDCRVSVTENENTYEASCTNEAPNGDKRCKVEFSRKNEIVSGSVFCDKIPNQRFLGVYRYFVSPGSMNKPAKIAVHNCEGL